jgi:two-component system nitrogen regulation sensor histidine kinase NtrY
MTTREKGTGLGLAIVKKIVEDHGGRLELHDAPADFHEGRGALIRILLPRAAQDAAEQIEGGAAHNEPEQVGNGI